MIAGGRAERYCYTPATVQSSPPPVPQASPPPPLPEVAGSAALAALVAALGASQVIGTVVALLPPVIAPAIAAGHGLPVVVVGAQSALMFAGMAACLTFGTNLAPRWGCTRAIQIGMLLMAIGAATITAGHVALLVLGSLLTGFGYGFVTPSNTHILQRFTPAANRNVVFSIVQAGVPLGVLLAASAGPAIAVAAGWQAALWSAAGLCLALAIALQPGRPTWDSDRRPALPMAANPLTPLRVMWSVPPLRMIAFAGGTLACGQVVIHSYTVAMFYEQLSMSMVQAGFVLTVAQLGAVVARPFWGWLADRSRDCLGTLMALSAILSAAAAAAATLGLGWPLDWTYGLFFVLGVTASGWHGAFLGEVARLAPADRVSTATGGTLIFIHLSSIVTPLAFAAVYALIRSYTLGFGLLVVPSLASIALLGMARRRATATLRQP